MVERKIELSKTLAQKLRTVTHIVNVLNRRCIVKHEVKIYNSGDDIIVDVFLAPFLDRVFQYDAINQVRAQLTLPMFFKGDTKFHMINFFDWSVIKEGKKKEDKCYIRFVVYQKPYSELFCCKTCGEIATKLYGRGGKRNCPKCGVLEYDKYVHKRISE
jgi:hypothetical protein